MNSSQKPVVDRGEITLVVAQSPRYYPHVQRHLSSLKKVFSKVRLLYWEKDPHEPLYSFPGVEARRVVLPFQHGGTWFFLKLMVGFFFHLRTMRPESIEAIDPYALVPARLHALFRGGAGRPGRIAYFSMEYFSELPSLRSKPFKRWIWKKLERWGVSGISAAATVCDGIAEHLQADFGMPVVTVRNVPERSRAITAEFAPESGDKVNAGVAAGAEAEGKVQLEVGAGLHERCGQSADTPILIYQGMLQEGRGLETAIQALPLAPKFHLALIGGGPLRDSLGNLATGLGCLDRTHFLGEVDFRALTGLTRGASAGLAPFQALSTSYRYSLPGKLFEYVQAGIPVIATALPEIRKVMAAYTLGICLEDYRPETLAAAMEKIRRDEALRSAIHADLPRAQADLSWESEEARYLSMYTSGLYPKG